MRQSFTGNIRAETNPWGQVKDLVIVSEDGDFSRLSRNDLWEKIKALVGNRVQLEGSCYFLPNKDRVINVKKIVVLDSVEKKIHLERIS